MSAKRYTASYAPTTDGTGMVMSFRHPLRKDKQGKQGRKVRKGLSTRDPERAQKLVDDMNLLLGDPSWHSIARRAEAENRFDQIIVRAFFDDIEGVPDDSAEVRDDAIRLPDAEDGYSHVMLVGATGAGKTSLLRHLIGSDPVKDRFPSTSTSRTTISDIEVVTSENPTYQAVVTFYNESTVRTNIHECVAHACASLWEEQSDEKLSGRLLEHRDQRFRLGYIIGTWKQTSAPTENEGDWDYDEDVKVTSTSEGEDYNLPTAEDLERMHGALASYLERVRDLAEAARGELEVELGAELATLGGADKEAAQDRFEDIVQARPGFDDLVNDIMGEVRQRFEDIGPGTLDRHPGGWPKSWYFEEDDRKSFVREVRRFSSNYAPAFGTLLTPLVDGIRIKGCFFPSYTDTDHRPRLVLFDGEGIGHVEDASAGLSTRIARRLGTVHVILLVDSAIAPMLEGPVSVLRAVAASGYQDRLAIAFTRFDQMKGQDNLPTVAARRAHVLSSLQQKLAGLREVVGKPAVRTIERELDTRCFMLGFLDRPLAKENKGPVQGLTELLEFCETAHQRPDAPSDICPVYDTAGLVLAVQAAANDFHERWDAILGFRTSSTTTTAHWATVKALNRRVALDMNNGEYGDLRPAANLAGLLAESVTKYLDKPYRWEPRMPEEHEADEALARIQRAVFTKLHEFAAGRVLHTYKQQWVKAFDFRGVGSTRERAQTIQTIYEAAVPILSPGLDNDSEEFLRAFRTLVLEAIHQGGGKLVSGLWEEHERASQNKEPDDEQ